jgi:hypothetical protein
MQAANGSSDSTLYIVPRSGIRFVNAGGRLKNQRLSGVILQEAIPLAKPRTRATRSPPQGSQAQTGPGVPATNILLNNHRRRAV